MQTVILLSHVKGYVGTDVILKIKENSADEDFDQYLEEYKLRAIIKIFRFYQIPIKMNITRTRLKEGSEKNTRNIQRNRL